MSPAEGPRRRLLQPANHSIIDSISLLLSLSKRYSEFQNQPRSLPIKFDLNASSIEFFIGAQKLTSGQLFAVTSHLHRLYSILDYRQQRSLLDTPSWFHLVHIRAMLVLPPNERFPLLSNDVYLEILARLPELRDKLAFSCTCRASLLAARDPWCWETIDVSEAAWRLGRSHPAHVCHLALCVSKKRVDGTCCSRVTGCTKDSARSRRWSVSQ